MGFFFAYAVRRLLLGLLSLRVAQRRSQAPVSTVNQRACCATSHCGAHDRYGAIIAKVEREERRVRFADARLFFRRLI